MHDIKLCVDCIHYVNNYSVTGSGLGNRNLEHACFRLVMAKTDLVTGEKHEDMDVLDCRLERITNHPSSGSCSYEGRCWKQKKQMADCNNALK